MGRGQNKKREGGGVGRPTFRALSRLSMFDSRRTPRGKEETTRSLIFLSKFQPGFLLYI